MVNALAKAAPVRGCASTTRIVADDHSEILILGSGPQSSFPKARMPDARHTFSIDLNRGMAIVLCGLRLQPAANR